MLFMKQCFLYPLSLLISQIVLKEYSIFIGYGQHIVCYWNYNNRVLFLLIYLRELLDPIL